ncbi:unnamed protein product [Oikopleura dioica]|uniref:Uncharacterized protein n=1 Tax=Oikopleura dioica TaxID=34765 RepID=E4YV86_OIKDI|nr:unnamed protein product [Oikopleura dioica]
MNGRESCGSLRSMEILSPEPPRDLNIPVYGSSDEDGVKSCGDKKSKNSKKKKNSESSYQDEKLTRGLAKIQSNDLTLLELRARQFELREETEKIRRENAQGFFKLRHLLGKKGKSILHDIYFNEYPHLQKLENGSETGEDIVSPRNGVVSASSDDSNYADLREGIFYQTQVLENGSISERDKFENNEDPLINDEEDEELALYLERSERRANFIERNKELAVSGDILTKIERERLDAILASDSVDNADENNDSEIRLAQINTELENKFSSTALVPVDIEETFRSEKRLKEIDSRLSFIQSQANLRTGSSQLLAIADIEAESNDSSAISKMLAEFQLELEQVSLASTCDVMSEQEEEPISEDKIQELLASSRTELNLS